MTSAKPYQHASRGQAILRRPPLETWPADRRRPIHNKLHVKLYLFFRALEAHRRPNLIAAAVEMRNLSASDVMLKPSSRTGQKQSRLQAVTYLLIFAKTAGLASLLHVNIKRCILCTDGSQRGRQAKYNPPLANGDRDAIWGW